MALSFPSLSRGVHIPSLAPLSRLLPWQKTKKPRQSLRAKAKVSARGTKSKRVPLSPLERVAEARRQGKSLVCKGANPRLDRYLANTPIALCRDEEWENMHDVGREIID